MEERLGSAQSERQAAVTAISAASTFTPTPRLKPAASPIVAAETAAPRSDDSEINIDETEMVNPSSDLPQSESVNVWPDEAAESAFLAETRGAETAKPVFEAKVKEETSLAPLPKLDELVSRIPAEARELLEELFRAKFTTVRRVKQSDLKA